MKQLTAGILHVLLSLIGLQTATCQPAAAKPDSSDKLELKIDSLIQTRMEAEQIPGAAILVLKDGHILLKKGYGYARTGANSQPMDPDSSIFRIGSITKTFTAMAVLKLAESGQIDLHTDVNQYLKSVQVPPTFAEPITAAQLLTHSAGLDELPGRLVFEADAQQPLASFLEDRLVRTRPPGLVSSYSTYGIALAGLLVEDVSGQSLESFMRTQIWEPLGMLQTSITLPETQSSQLALGYEIEGAANVAQPWEWYHTFPASSINSTLAEMGHYMQMLLDSGRYAGHQVLRSSLAHAMQSPQLSVHPAVDGFAYGFYQRDRSGLEVWNHGGDMRGYSCWMALAPAEQLAVMVMHHHEGTGLRTAAIELVMEHFGSPSPPTGPPDRLESDLSEFAGTYKWMTHCYTCPNQREIRLHELTVNPDHTLSGFGRQFYQLAPLLFKSYDGQRTMGFVRDEKGEIRYMSLGNINAFEKVAD